MPQQQTQAACPLAGGKHEPARRRQIGYGTFAGEFHDHAGDYRHADGERFPERHDVGVYLFLGIR